MGNGIRPRRQTQPPPVPSRLGPAIRTWGPVLLYILPPHSSRHQPAVTSRWAGFAVGTVPSAPTKAWSRLPWQQTPLLATSTTISEPFASHGREAENAEGRSSLEDPQRTGPERWSSGDPSLSLCVQLSMPSKKAFTPRATKSSAHVEPMMGS